MQPVLLLAAHEVWPPVLLRCALWDDDAAAAAAAAAPELPLSLPALAGSVEAVCVRVCVCVRVRVCVRASVCVYV